MEEKKEKTSLKRALSNKNVMRARFEVAQFTGEWLRSFGKPELSGTWIVYGGSGCGKTTFVMMMCKYLTNFGRVAYDSLEQGLSLSLQRTWERVGMEEAGNRIMLLEKESMQEVRERLRRKWAPQIVVIDSLQYWQDFCMRDHMRLRAEFPKVLFIYISQARGGQPDGKLAQRIRYDSDVKIRVEGYKAFFTTRYENPDAHEGGEDFIIWDKGAREYWSEI